VNSFVHGFVERLDGIDFDKRVTIPRSTLAKAIVEVVRVDLPEAFDAVSGLRGASSAS